MSRLLIHVEGQTEETFVNSILAPHLHEYGFTKIGARLLGNARARERRGGIRSWDVARKEIDLHLAGDVGCVATTMVDYYALPDNWPGKTTSLALPFEERGAHLQSALAQDFAIFSSRAQRFVPFVLMHEFEALLFSDCQAFGHAVGQSQKIAEMEAIRAAFPTPEHINNSPLTAPSKRMLGIIPGYQKPLYGAVGALGIGLPKIKAECPHFRSWIEKLEQHCAA